MTTELRESPARLRESFFDAYAEKYDEVLNAALAASGETREFFAIGRMKCLARLLQSHGAEIGSVLDYGCGTGASTPLFFQTLHCRSLVGVDVSAASLETAARCQSAWPARFELLHDHQPTADIDLAYTNGTFHHIHPAARLSALAHIHRSLNEGGLLAFCENNPYNPGTRHCMAANPFDRGTVPVSPLAARRILRIGGFDVLEMRYLFFFPRLLGVLRFAEPYLARVPLGAQYLLLAAKRPEQQTRSAVWNAFAR